MISTTGPSSKSTSLQRKKIDLLKELQSLNNLLSKHDINYEEFSVCLKHCFLPERSFGFISRKKIIERNVIQFFSKFWAEADKNGSMTWNVTRDKISILYYFNDENIDLEKMLFLLNEFAKNYGLDSKGCKLLFTMAVSDSQHWNYDYFKRIEFIVRK